MPLPLDYIAVRPTAPNQGMTEAQQQEIVELLQHHLAAPR
jgi:hypothetical protein